MIGTRSSGILLHPTSLPGPYGIGDLGEDAYWFIDFLHETGQSLWQILPLGPPSAGNSPYSSFSAFAGNPYLIGFQLLVQEGLLSSSELWDRPPFAEHAIDFGSLYKWKYPILQKAYENFRASGRHNLGDDFDHYCREEAWWLDDYALFAALKEAYQGAMWNCWDPDIAHREPEALARWQKKLAEEIRARKFWQFLFDRQWSALKQYANSRKVRIIGDIPIYCAYDSDDVWSHPELFHLNAQGNPTVVAGVPPDYFSATGQLWGNPIYNWELMAQHRYGWWIDRFRSLLKRVDIVRLDHFRGFESYWEVPAEEETAINGCWVQGPGPDLLNTIRDALGGLPIIAENLGLITQEVEDLRKQFNIPGMAVLHFAFDPDSKNSDYLPHKYIHNLVVYTGTHDNDTTVGWWNQPDQSDYCRRERQFAADYMDIGDRPVQWVFIRTALASVADIAIVPLQDVMGLGGDARMNVPGIGEGNWGWRFSRDQITNDMRGRLREMTKLYGRWPEGGE